MFISLAKRYLLDYRLHLAIIARVTSIFRIKKGGVMKRSIQECEDLDDYAAAMADALREDEIVKVVLQKAR